MDSFLHDFGFPLQAKVHVEINKALEREKI